VDGLARIGSVGRAQTYMRTRHFLCQHCCLEHKSCVPPKLRLDTIRQTLICCTCSNTDILSVDMVGRVLRHKRQSFVLCPVCVQVRQYTGNAEIRAWILRGECQHDGHRSCSKPAGQTNRGGAGRPVCMSCSEAATQHRIERVDHLSGTMRQFFFCQRHLPRPDELARCVNARQLAQRYCSDEHL